MTEKFEQKKEYRAPEMKIVALEPCNLLQPSLQDSYEVVIE
ncbi:hypothetical protein [Fibrobacter sp. UWB5]|nr:hypothetical protein [Fibrobacter sp. UWB5]